MASKLWPHISGQVTVLEGTWVGGWRGNQVEVLFKSLKKGKALASSIQLALETSPHLHLLNS